ncbi:MAG: calcium-binding protein [Myxococcota bacterium]
MLLLALALVNLSHADECASTDAPDPVDDDPCSDVCIMTNAGSDFSIECDISTATGTTDGHVYAMHRYDASSKEYTFWGQTADNDDFCCAFDEPSSFPERMVEITINGGAGDDVLMLSDSTSTYSMDQALVVNVYGNEGMDFIMGTSDRTDHEYNLYGGDDNDTIECREDACYVEGGSDHDVITGSDQGDIIYGDNAGVVGGSYDYISGKDETDYLYGQGGNDIICGGSLNDYLYGESGLDILWGAGGSPDYAHGGTGPSNDKCGAESVFECEAVQTTIPSECP